MTESEKDQKIIALEKENKALREAERDLRMMKCQQKISGCFRCAARAVDFANIRSVLSTARKQNLNLLQVLTNIFSGQLPVFS